MLVWAEGEFPVMLKLSTKESIEPKVIKTLRAGIEMSLTHKNYSLIDENTQEEALEEQVNQQKSECYDDNCLVDVGRMIAARALFIVEILKLEDNKYLFKSRFIDLETAETKKAIAKIYSYSFDDSEKLLEFSESLTADLLAHKVVIIKTIDIELNVDKFKLNVLSGKCKASAIKNNSISLSYNKGKKCKIEIIKPYFHRMVKNLEFNKNQKIKISLKEFKKYKTKFILIPLDVNAKLVNTKDKKDVINLKSGKEFTFYENNKYELNATKDGYSSFSQKIDTNKLNEKYIISLDKISVKYLQAYAVFDVTIASYLKYMSAGIGTTIYSRESGKSYFSLLSVNFYRNLTDNYFYSDVELTAYKYKVFNGFTTGISVSFLPIFADDFLFTGTGNLDFEYKYNISAMFVKAKVRAGLSYYKTDESFRPFLTSGISIGYDGF